ncbi:hypothetical protein SAMN05443247_06566 [Bradyrhizobium erythrophlei]|nr:hypothetical protein SAMN05443247_06566 [Bradyrhizobium erythrophlei]
MATEQEELRLTVTLADNASAGLEKLQAQIKELGGGGGAGGNKHIEKLNEGTKALTETVMKMTGSFGEAFKSLGMLRLGFIGGVAGVAAFGYEMAKQLKDLGEYTDKLRNIGQIGKNIGVDRVAIKNIADQLAVYGVSLDQTTASAIKFAEKMAELQRDPRARLGILQQTDPRHAADMNARIDALNRATQIEDKLNIVRQIGEDVRRNARARGESEERAADEARQARALFGYDQELSYAGELKKRNAEQKTADDARNAAADHYSETLGKIKGLLEDISNIQSSRLVNWFTPAAEQFERILGHLKEGIEGAMAEPGGARGFYQRLLKEREERQPHSFEDRWPREEEQLKPWQPGGVQKQSYRGMGIDGSLLHQTAFVTEDHKKGVDANTEQLKRLNDLLMQAMGLSGSAAGGGGFQNAALATGGPFGGGGLAGRGTIPRGFGGGGYANLGTTYGGAAAAVGAGVDSGAARSGPTPRGGGGGGGGPAAAAGVDGGAARTPRMSQSRREVAQIAAGALRAGGMSENMVAGIFANVADESSFNPNLRHPDQPKFGGEAHFAHGLYQEGGTEWNNYAAWIAKNHPDGNWRDPKLQSDFLAENLKKNYPGTWKRMQAARSPGEAGSIFVNEYLKPAAGYRISRSNKYLRGVPGVSAYTGADQITSAAPTVPSSPQTAADQPAPSTLTPEQLRAYGERRLMNQPGDLTRENLLAHARRSMDAEQNAATKVEGNAKIRVDVNAPKGTNVGAEASGLFSTVETYRQTQMAPANRGPPAETP